MKRLKAIAFLLLILNDLVVTDTNCPEKCVCRRIDESSSALKVKCGGLATKLSGIKDVDFSAIKDDVVHL